jgi:Tfp pilus assembly protein PilP
MKRIATAILLAAVFAGIVSAVPANRQQAPSLDRKHDPFKSPIVQEQTKSNASARGHWSIKNLVVGKLRVDGIVKYSEQPVAIVTNGSGHTFFLREGDRLWDGEVEKISMDGVTFHEEGKDAFGKPVERSVNKRIYSMAGEQQ